MRQIYLIGIGMGNPDTLTVGAQKIIARSDCLIGAKRMLQTVNHPTARQFSSFRNEEIAEYIAQQPKSSTISVLLSGDTGFYSWLDCSKAASRTTGSSSWRASARCNISAPSCKPAGTTSSFSASTAGRSRSCRRCAAIHGCLC